MPEFVSEKINNEKMEQHTTDTSIELDVQGIPGFVWDKINGEKTKEHTPDTLMEVDMLDKIQDSPDPLQGTENKQVGNHDNIKTVNQQDSGKTLANLRDELYKFHHENHNLSVQTIQGILIFKL